MQAALPRTYIHGGGRRGREAWPRQREDAAYLSFPATSTIAEQVDAVASSAPGGLVFAHSIGAVPAVLAARVLRPRGLVLVEPALYDIARGEAVIERHIGIVSEARSQADAGNLRGFWAIMRPLMFGGPFDATHWAEERALAERWSVTNLPWGHGVRACALDDIPTLVVTGGWNQEYELLADMLAARGARHAVLSGAQHRPQDLPGFEALITDFAAGLTPGI